MSSFRHVTAVAALAAVLVGGSVTPAGASPAKRCAKVTVKGKRYTPWAHNVSCAFARRWSVRYISARRSAPGYRCQRFNGPLTNIPWFCRERNPPTTREFREYWVTR
jgi:hypothetical protein